MTFIIFTKCPFIPCQLLWQNNEEGMDTFFHFLSQSNLQRHIHVHTWRYNNTHLTQTAALQQLLHPGWKQRGYIMGYRKGNSLWGRLLLKYHFFSFFNIMTRGRVCTKERLFSFFMREKLNIKIWSLTQLSFISVRDRQSSWMISFQKTYCNTHRTYSLFF